MPGTTSRSAITLRASASPRASASLPEIIPSILTEVHPQRVVLQYPPHTHQHSSSPLAKEHPMNRYATTFILATVTVTAFSTQAASAQATAESARTVQYHAQDIVPIHAKLKFTTLIVVPPTEKIMEAATGDKDFWVVDVVGNFCFVHPAKQGISSNLNLITDKGNIYSFTLQDVSGTSVAPDLKVIIEPADRSSIVASTGPAQYVPAAQVQQVQQQLNAVQTHIGQAVDEYKEAYPLALKFDYRYKANSAPFNVQSIYHDEKLSLIHI